MSIYDDDQPNFSELIPAFGRVDVDRLGNDWLWGLVQTETSPLSGVASL